ncbi:MAG: type I restriction enzyme HsdR N-terminal domain-containing protein [Cyanobacteria bacterium J06560_6]
MSQLLQANQLTLRDVKDKFGLQRTRTPDFFGSWQQPLSKLSEHEKKTLDQAQASFLYLSEGIVQEPLVKMVVVSPLLSVAGFYKKPYLAFAEHTTEVEITASEEIIRGRIDVLVVNQRVWVAIVEAKNSQLSLSVSLPQTLAYMASDKQTNQPKYGLVTNGTDLQFVKLDTEVGLYALSRAYSLNNPGNDLYEVVSVLRTIS